MMFYVIVDRDQHLATHDLSVAFIESHRAAISRSRRKLAA